jgi:hypothetical protein
MYLSVQNLFFAELVSARLMSAGPGIATSRLNELFPPTVDYPARHIGPRKHDARLVFHGSLLQFVCTLPYTGELKLYFCFKKILNAVNQY